MQHVVSVAGSSLVDTVERHTTIVRHIALGDSTMRDITSVVEASFVDSIEQHATIVWNNVLGDSGK